MSRYYGNNVGSIQTKASIGNNAFVNCDDQHDDDYKCNSGDGTAVSNFASERWLVVYDKNHNKMEVEDLRYPSK